MKAQLPKHVALEELGLNFEIPDGWSGGIQDDYILLGHQTIPGMIILLQHHSKTAKELKSLAAQGISEDGVTLSPSSEFEIANDTRVEGYYEGLYNGTPIKAFAVGLINAFGSGLSLLIFTETNKFTSVHEQEANKLLKTVHFSAPKAENNDQVQFWQDRLRGKKLHYMYTKSSSDYGGGSTGYNERKIVNLCENGRFNYYSNAHAAIDTGTNAGGFSNAKENSEGNYIIYGAQSTVLLDLAFDNGETYTVELTTDNARVKTFVDGTRYFIDGEAECQ
ncbi:hypothetical protein N9954_09270 [Maribacter sp.]|nr:hypothetical protein [Maribacter sp.]